MRKKIEELRNKEEGFTLVELLAVIVILGIIVAIAIPAVGSIINRANIDADEAEQELIVDAARLYVTTNDKTLFEGTNSVTINVTGDVPPSLEKEGYLELRGDSKASDYEGDKVEVSRTGDGTSESPYEYEYNYKPGS